MRKLEIFEGLSENGVAILNADIPTLPILKKARGDGRSVLFGQSAGADIRLIKASVSDHGSAVEAVLHGDPILFKLGAPGEHLAMNGLAVLAAVEAAGGDVAQSMLALASWQAPSGRGQRFTVQLGETGGSVELIDESYNANPTSIVAAAAQHAAATPAQENGRRVAFLGDMLELGPQEQAYHSDLSDAVPMAAIDKVHTSGPLMAALHAALPDHRRGQHFDAAAQMAACVNRLLDSGDVAMVKGSLGSKVGQVVTAIKTLGQTSEK